MGITQLWSALSKDGHVQKLAGKDEIQEIFDAVEGKVIAIDLSMWILQAQQQDALLGHFTQSESAIKVAFERSMQMLRHGCLPVIVVEGTPPEEKRQAQQQRFKSRNKYHGGGTAHGSQQFTAQSKVIARVLEHLGLPVLYAPGEAEVTCAALCARGLVDAVATFDSDALVYDCEVIFHTLKLSVADVKSCEITRLVMADVRRALGIQRGGGQALLLVGLIAGGDYASGASGVGATTALAFARYLLRDHDDDTRIIELFQDAIKRQPNLRLLTLKQCTGCKTCGHEGHMAGKIQRHTAKNPCDCCPSSSNGGCCATAFGRCQCDFHRLADDRNAEKMLEKLRTDPTFLDQALKARDVYSREYEKAKKYVDCYKTDHGIVGKMKWLHRPKFLPLFNEIANYAQFGLDWDKSTVRSKMLPVLMEWDLQHPNAPNREFRADAVVKEQGSAGVRYLVDWSRIPRANAEGITEKLRVKIKPVGDTSAVGASQNLLSSPGGTQRQEMTLEEADVHHLKSFPAEKRSARITAVNQHWPELVARWQAKRNAKGNGKGRPRSASAQVVIEEVAKKKVTKPTPSTSSSQHKEPSLENYLSRQTKPRTLTGDDNTQLPSSVRKYLSVDDAIDESPIQQRQKRQQPIDESPATVTANHTESPLDKNFALLQRLTARHLSNQASEKQQKKASNKSTKHKLLPGQTLLTPSKQQSREGGGATSSQFQSGDDIEVLFSPPGSDFSNFAKKYQKPQNNISPLKRSHPGGQSSPAALEKIVEDADSVVVDLVTPLSEKKQKTPRTREDAPLVSGRGLLSSFDGVDAKQQHSDDDYYNGYKVGDGAAPALRKKEDEGRAVQKGARRSKKNANRVVKEKEEEVIDLTLSV